MNREELLKLREQVVAQTYKLAMNSDIEPAAKLNVLMGLIHSGDSSLDLLWRAYETGQLLADDTDKLDAFLDLLYEIDNRLAPDAGEADAKIPAEEDVSDHSSPA